MKKNRHYKKSYEKYVKEFKAEKKENNIKRDVRQMTRKQYESFRNEGYSHKEILKSQIILKNKRIKEKVWKEYSKLELKNGETSVYDNSYWGKNIYETEGLNKHRSLKALMKDRHMLHFMITQTIDEIGDRDEALAYYGY